MSYDMGQAGHGSWTGSDDEAMMMMVEKCKVHLGEATRICVI